MFFYWRFLCLFIFGVVALNGLAQDEAELRKMDSLAFSALERNDNQADHIAGKFLKATLAQKPDKYRVNAYTILGILNKNKGFYLSSLDYYLKSLETARVIKDEKRISACFNNIATVYRLQGNFSKAIEYFEKSLELEKTFGNQLQISIRYFNLGDCYNAIDSLDLALSYYNSSLILEKKMNNQEGVVLAEQGIAEIYIKSGRLNDAGLILSRINGKTAKLGLEAQLIQLKLLAKLRGGNGDFVSGLKYLEEGLKLSDKSTFRTFKLEFLKLRIELLKKSADNPSGLNKAYAEYLLFLDWFENYNAKNRLDDLSYRDELSRKQLIIELAQQKRKIAEENEKEERQLRVYSQKMVFFTFFLVLFILALVIYGVQKITKHRDL